MKALSREVFERQLAIPGLVMFRARSRGETVAAHLWMKDGDVVHSHLAAANERGYQTGAAYALYWTAIEHFAGDARWLNFGAGAGSDGADPSGLTRFKKAWATGTRTAYFCGRILNRRRYTELLERRGISHVGYFPAYRAGEFAPVAHAHDR
jgi:hypothetical protein